MKVQWEILLFLFILNLVVGLVIVLAVPGAAYVNPSVATSDSSQVLFLPFEEGTGSTTQDLSGNDNDGTISGANWTTGQYGSALSFNGSGACVNIEDSSELRFTGAFTISLWANRSGASSGTYGVLIGKAGSIATRNYQIYWTDAGAISFAVRDVTNGVTRTTSLTGYAETGTWRFIVAVYDNTNLTVYVNTAASTPTAMVGTLATSSDIVRIGRLSWDVDNNYCFNGDIDEVRVFNRALTSTEIDALYDGFYISPELDISEYEEHFNATDVAESWSATPFTGIPIIGDIFGGFNFMFTAIGYLIDGFPVFLTWIKDSYITDPGGQIAFDIISNVLRAVYALLATIFIIEFISGRIFSD